MLGKLFQAMDGYKTYTLAALGIIIAVAGHFWGPFTIAGAQIPQFSWDDVWKLVYQSGVISTLRHAIGDSTP